MIVYIFYLIILILDIYAVYLICKDVLSDTEQKKLQILLVIFIPFFGLLLVIAVNKNKPFSNGKFPEDSNHDNFASDGNVHSNHDAGGDFGNH
jgi:hypothetical protein